MPVLVLDDDDTVSVGSRAICYAKRTLEILDRLGCGEPIAAQGRGWNVGKVYQGSELAYQFDLLPEAGHHRPAFVNLQQYYFEECLVERARDVAAARDCAGGTRSTASRQRDDGVDADRRHRRRRLRAHVRLARRMRRRAQSGAPHARPRLRGAGVPRPLPDRRHPHGDRTFPPERRFWFDPPFHPQPVGAAASPARRRVARRLPARLGRRPRGREAAGAHRCRACARCSGHDARFEIEWASVYTFQCRRMQKFRHGRLLFAGDAAHLVSPFGARGANSGVQDADNLAWKLDARHARARARARCSTRYDSERVAAADENLRNSTRSTDFITPKSAVSRTFRDAVLVARAAPPVRAHARQQRPPVGAGGADAIRRSTPPDDDALRRERWCRARRRPTRRSTARAARGSSLTWAAASRC